MANVNPTPTTIEQYREAKSHYLKLKNQAKKELVARFNALATELLQVQRELLEETGYTAESWRYIATSHPCIGYSDEKLIYYLAEKLTFTTANLDDGEHLEVFTLSLENALDWIKNGKITDNKTVFGLFWAEKLLRGEW